MGRLLKHMLSLPQPLHPKGGTLFSLSFFGKPQDATTEIVGKLPQNLEVSPCFAGASFWRRKHKKSGFALAAPDFFRCSSSSFLAHRAPDGREQTVAEHLRRTAEQAACDASFFGAETLAKLAGLTHDLGKYSLEFQERLQGKAQTVDHSTAGMAECCKQGAISAALAVAGHHAAPPSAENSTIWPRVSSSSTRHRCCLYPIYGPVCGLFLSW